MASEALLLRELFDSIGLVFFHLRKKQQWLEVSYPQNLWITLSLI